MNRNYDHAFVVMGTRADPHVERVADEVARFGDVRVEVLDYREDTKISLTVDGNGKTGMAVNGFALPRSLLIWDRGKIMPGTTVYVKGDDPSVTGFVAREWRALYQLISGLYGDKVVNSLDAKKCLLKPYQQVIASRVGLNVPMTLVTNDKAAAVDLMHYSPSGLILKSLCAGKVAPGPDGGNVPFNIMTMRVSEEDLAAADAEDIGYCPHVFQHEIRKDHELRIVMIDGKPHPFRIDSQLLESSTVDWRKGVHLLDYAPCEIQDALADKLRAYMRAMGLFSGSVDIVVDRDGNDWFLECNQDGAWGWLDEIVDGALTREFASAFRRRLMSQTAESADA
jgi:hypothetical protein